MGVPEAQHPKVIVMVRQAHIGLSSPLIMLYIGLERFLPALQIGHGSKLGASVRRTTLD